MKKKTNNKIGKAEKKNLLQKRKLFSNTKQLAAMSSS